MKRILLLGTLVAALSALNLAAQPDPNYKPKRLNKIIELLQDSQIIFGVGAGGRGEEGAGGAAQPGYEEGKKLAKTGADFINYESEHSALDFQKLREFMKGVADGGPSRSGHRLTPVVVTLPVTGLDGPYVRANTWVIQEALAAGVMGVVLCHARTPEAVAAFVQASRYPFERAGLVQTAEGLRGAGSQSYAAQIWGISPNMYLHVADPWPLNPQGEITLKLKIEDKYALANSEKIAAVPGIAFAEWGPTDQLLSLVGLPAYADTSMPAGGARGGRGPGGRRGPLPPALEQARTRIKNALHANHEAFQGECTIDNIEAFIKEGVNVCGYSEAVAEKARALQKRKMPW